MNPDPQAAAEDKPLSPLDGGELGAGIDWSDPNSPLAPYYFSTGGVVAVAVLGLAFFLFSSIPLWHTDFWAHLKYGEWIVANRALPDVEPLNPWTDQQKPMFDAMWLSQVGYHSVFRLGAAIAGGDAQRQLEGGVEAIRLIHLLAVIAALGLFGLAYRHISDSVPWGIIGMVLLVVLMRSAFSVQRPQTFGLAFYAGLLCLLSRPVLSRPAQIGVPILMVLWANVHGTFVVGIGLVGLFWLSRLMELAWESRFTFRVIRQDLAFQRLSVVLGASLIAVGLLNPYGPALYWNLARFGGSPNLATMVEWQPLDFSQPRGGHWAYLAVLGFLVVTQLASPRRFNTTQWLLILTLGIWPLFQQRAMSWWLPVVPWIAAPHWVAAAKRWGFEAATNIPSFRKTAFAAIIAIAAVMASPATIWLKSGEPRPAERSLHRATPYDVAAVLQGQQPLDRDRMNSLDQAMQTRPGGRFTGRIFCSETLGEYLLWALPDDCSVLMYNHAQLFSPTHWNECLAVKGGAPQSWEILERHHVDLVVVEAELHPRLCQELKTAPGWDVVLDESGLAGRDRSSRLFIGIRKTVPPTAGTP